MAAGISAIVLLNLKRVIVVDVALGAGRGHMSAGERKARDGMVERVHVRPGDRVVTLRAIRGGKGRARRGVNGIVGGLPGGEVAASVPAVSRSRLQIVVVVDVALRALQIRVAVGEREARGAVIKNYVGPGRRVVAVRAIRDAEGRASAWVRRVVSLLPGGEVAAGVAAVSCRDLEMIVVADVALLARHVGVPESQREVDRRRSVIAIEACTEPAIEGLVAGLAATGREVGGILGVRRIGGVLPIFEVTRLAVGGQAVENADGGLLMAVIALHGRVCAEERKSILVFFYLLRSDGPTLDGVALGTIGAHLAAVNVAGFVAVRAIFSNVREDGLDVALDALNFFVHAAEGIIGFVVIEFRDRANGAPTCGSVTVLTGDCEGAVRIAGGLVLRIARCIQSGRGSVRSGIRTRKHKQSPKSELE